MDRHNLLFSDVNGYSEYLQQYMLGGYFLGANIAGPDMNGEKYSDGEWTYDIKLQYFSRLTPSSTADTNADSRPAASAWTLRRAAGSPLARIPSVVRLSRHG